MEFTLLYTADKENRISGKHNGNTRIWHLDWLKMALCQAQTSVVTLLLSRVLLWEKHETHNVRN